tara:strand:+ start:1858 stop:2193 length:336 start_codon:yes stop_codon:yes gene_type:complete
MHKVIPGAPVSSIPYQNVFDEGVVCGRVLRGYDHRPEPVSCRCQSDGCAAKSVVGDVAFGVDGILAAVPVQGCLIPVAADDKRERFVEGGLAVGRRWGMCFALPLYWWAGF